MIDHLSIPVNNFQESRVFYDETLSILGYERLLNFQDETYDVVGYGKEGRPAFWIGGKKILLEDNKRECVNQVIGLHIAFAAPDVQAVQKWHTKCLELGAQDNGAPGPRPQYHPGYYGGFVIDPSGWRIEACFQNYQGEILI